VLVLFLMPLKWGLLESLQSIIKLAPTTKHLLRQTNLAHCHGNRRILSLQNFYLPKLRHNRLGFLAFFKPSLILKQRDNFQGGTPPPWRLRHSVQIIQKSRFNKYLRFLWDIAMRQDQTRNRSARRRLE